MKVGGTFRLLEFPADLVFDILFVLELNLVRKYERGAVDNTRGPVSGLDEADEHVFFPLEPHDLAQLSRATPFTALLWRKHTVAVRPRPRASLLLVEEPRAHLWRLNRLLAVVEDHYREPVGFGSLDPPAL